MTIQAQIDPLLDVPDRPTEARNLVSDVLLLPAGSHVSFYEQRARLLGDSVAIAITKVLRPRDLQDLDNAKRVLTLLQDAYSDPSSIQAAEDKNPGVTLVLLNYLMDHVVDLSTRQRTQELTTRLEAVMALQK